MPAAHEPPPSQRRIANPAEAERLVEEVIETVRALDALLAAETAELRAGRIRQALAEEERKSALTASYLRALEGVKANAIALARFSPQAVERLKAAHAAFGRTIEANRTVLATARSVSETLLKSVSEEMGRRARPQTYAPAGVAAPRTPRTEALVVARSL